MVSETVYRRVRWTLGVVLVLGVALTGSSVLAADPVSVETQYRNLSSTDTESDDPCGTDYAIRGRAPSGNGRYPVFVYLMGTFESFPTPAAQAAVERMARRGFLAVNMDYPNGSFGECPTLSRRSECAFDRGRSGSAVSAICGHPEADCTKGLVVAGFSQGSILSVLAHDFDTRVRSVYGMGAGVQYANYDLRSCVADGNRSLPSTRLRAVNGEGDGFMGGDSASVRAQLEELTGLVCGSDSVSCFRPDRSGWDIVLNGEVADGPADHCYMNDGGCFNSLDPRWANGSDSWALDQNLDWLVQTLERGLHDDRLEPNDDFDSATGLRDGTYDYLRARNDDVYALTLRQGDTMTATIRFASAPNDLDLSLHDPGRVEVDASRSTTADSETVAETDAAAGTYYVRVESPSTDTNPYSLTLSSTNAVGGSGGGGGGGCLIERTGASFALLGRLRRLRDGFLRTVVGRRVTRAYYRLFGPAA